MSSVEFFELLQMRYEFEELNRRFKNMPQGSDIETLQRFINGGYSRNRTRPGADKALGIAMAIVAAAPAHLPQMAE
jgi:hypothetical protein